MAKRSGGSGELVSALFKIFSSLVKLSALIVFAIGLAIWRSVAGVAGLFRVVFSKDRKHAAGQPSFTVKASLGKRGEKRPKRPPPPTLAEYATAGVDPSVCTLCRKSVPTRPREWKFCGMDGSPFVICPACWNKRYVNADHDAATQFMDRMTTYYSNEKPT